MHIATHLITIRGTFNTSIWDEELLKKYIDEKIRYKIVSTFHVSLEDLRVNKNNIYVSVFISCLPSEVNKSIVSLWIENNITEGGLKVTWFRIEEINCLYNKNKFSILID